MVAGRLQYREIADRLHASMRAVESHAALLRCTSSTSLTGGGAAFYVNASVPPGNSQPGAANDLAAVSKTCGLCAACRVAVRCGAPLTSSCMSSRSDERVVVGLGGCGVRVVDHDRVAVVAASMPAAGAVAEVADVFGLLADPGRLRVLVALLEGEMCVCDLAAVAQGSESAVSHHLRLLRAHRVVHVRRAGRMAYYRLADAHVRMLLDVALTHIGHAPAAAHPERDQIPESGR